jgi:hypothetical protein
MAKFTHTTSRRSKKSMLRPGFASERDQTRQFAQMYPASRESAAFGSKAMMGYARPVPNKWYDPEGRFFCPGLPNAVALFRHQLRDCKP